MKPLLATALSAVWLFASGALLYVFVLPQILGPLLADVGRSPPEVEARLWAVAAEKLAISAAMVFAARRMGGQRLRAGLLTGCLAIGMSLVPFSLSVFANFRIPGEAAAIFFVEGSLRLLVAGLIIAAVDRQPAA